MIKKSQLVAIPDEVVMNKIYLIRDKKVMLDRDLAELYGVETKRLKEAVRRNIDRFPEEFMFELTKEEFSNWRSQFATSNADKMGLRVPPFAFTEYGVLMLASVLNSERAIQVNIQIIKIFTKMREMLLALSVSSVALCVIYYNIIGYTECHREFMELHRGKIG